jgi:hypothetical protein
LPLWLTAKAKAGTPAVASPSRRAPRPPGASLPSTCPAPPTAIRAAAENPEDLPNPSRLEGNHSPVRPPTRWRRRRSEGGRRRNWSRLWERRPPQRPKLPVGGAGPTDAEHTYLPYFLNFLDVAPPSPSSSSPPTSRATALHQRLHYCPVATKVRTDTSLPLWTPRPSSRGGTCRRTALPRRRRW